ncbi:hypothetical protein Naga_102006g1, partial [Nannochloropsis gaditana]
PHLFSSWEGPFWCMRSGKATWRVCCGILCRKREGGGSTFEFGKKVVAGVVRRCRREGRVAEVGNGAKRLHWMEKGRRGTGEGSSKSSFRRRTKNWVESRSGGGRRGEGGEEPPWGREESLGRGRRGPEVKPGT